MKPKLTIQEHIKTGKILKRHRDDLHDLITLFHGRYGKTRDVNKGLNKSLAGTDAMRNALDAQIFEDYPNGDHILTEVYYGDDVANFDDVVDDAGQTTGEIPNRIENDVLSEQ